MQVTIDREALETIQWYVDKCHKEISGLGRIVKKGDVLHINKVYLLKQECTAVETELDHEAIAELLYESREDEGEMMFWWHSHVNMEVYWSGTDMDTIHQLGDAGMILSTVFNKKGEHRTSLFTKGDDIRPDMFLDNLELKVETGFSEEQVKKLTDEYNTKVTFPKQVYTGSKMASYYDDAYWEKWDEDDMLISGGKESLVDLGYSKFILAFATEPNVISTEAMIESFWDLLRHEQVKFLDCMDRLYGTAKRDLDDLTVVNLDELINFASWYAFDVNVAVKDINSHLEKEGNK